MPRYTVETNSLGTFWNKEGTEILHREDGPAIEHANGTKSWWVNGNLHREDGPAIEYADGSKEWYLNGNLHREDGPTYESVDGHKEWRVNGNLHREDGPAIEYADGSKAWYLNGTHMTESEFLKRNQKSCNGKTVEIDGVKYRLTVVE